jgi:hypothetical protein
MRLLLIVVACIPVFAQSPAVRISYTSRPGSTDYQIGDRFEILVTGAADEPVSVRTTMQGRTDWGPVIGSTDAAGRWSISGQFAKADFGSWREVWTVGGKVANPVLSFSVTGPCIPGGHFFMGMSGAYSEVLSCDTAAGPQTFAPSSDPFRTPDGRVVSLERPEQFMEDLIEDSGGHSGQHGDDAAALIAKVIGANALDDRERSNVLSIIRFAFQNLGRKPSDVTATLQLLQRLANDAEQPSLKQDIFETIAFVWAQ